MAHRNGNTISALLTLMLILSCGAERSNAPEGDETSMPGVGEGGFLSELSGAELAYIEELGDSIFFAVNEGELSYEILEDGSVIGFDYHYANALAEALEMKAEFVLLATIAEFFYRDGEFDESVMTDPSIRYSPDSFDRVQILAAPFAINEWRQRLMTMVPLFPVGVVLIGPDAGDITSFAQLDGKSIAVRRGDFQAPFLDGISAEYGIAIEKREYDASADVFGLLREGFADYTIDGSIFLAQGMQELEDLEASPLSLSLIPVGWGIAADNGPLASVFEKFVAYSLDEGILPAIWTEQMGVDFEFYLGLVGSN